MDPLTHALLGAAAAHVAFSRSLGRHAWWVGAGAALLPDADVFFALGEETVQTVVAHRGFTHALLFVPTGAAIAAALVAWMPIFRGRRHELLLACLLAYLTHPICDAWTSYGTMLLYPLSDVRVAWDVMSIVDPVFTLVLLVALAWGVVKRAVRPTAIGLAVALAWVGVGFVQHERAEAAAWRLAESRGHRVEHLRAMPTLGNWVVWRSLYRADDGRIYADAVRVAPLGGVTHRAGESVEHFDLAAIESGDPDTDLDIAGYAGFADGFTAMFPGPSDSDVIADVRYSREAGRFEPLWGVRVEEHGLVPTAIEGSRDNVVPALRRLARDVFLGFADDAAATAEAPPATRSHEP